MPTKSAVKKAAKVEAAVKAAEEKKEAKEKEAEEKKEQEEKEAEEKKEEEARQEKKKLTAAKIEAALKGEKQPVSEKPTVAPTSAKADPVIA